MRAFLLLLLLWAGALVHADGLAVAFEDEPTIPVQRAIIEFDGISESLTVQSTIDSKRADVGWIIPVPAKPTSVEQAWNETINQGFFKMRPRATYAKAADSSAAVMLLGFVFILLVCLWNRSDRKGNVVWFGLWGIFGLFLVAVLFPVFAQSSMGSRLPPAVDLVGSYEVKTIDGRARGDLESWLTEHRITPSATVLRQIEWHRAEGWWFVCATQRRGKPGEFPAHPIRITFPAKEPIYPMRLTGAQGSVTRVELLVVADGTAHSPHLDLWCSRPGPLFIRPSGNEIFEKFRIGQGQTVSYLRRELTLDQMKRDFFVEIGPATEMSVQPIKRSDVITLLLTQSLFLALPFAWLSGLIGAIHRKRCRDWIRWGSVVSVLVALVWTALWVIPAPKVDATVGNLYDYRGR